MDYGASQNESPFPLQAKSLPEPEPRASHHPLPSPYRRQPPPSLSYAHASVPHCPSKPTHKERSLRCLFITKLDIPILQQ
jgi:hypothetical protein